MCTLRDIRIRWRLFFRLRSILFILLFGGWIWAWGPVLLAQQSGDYWEEAARESFWYALYNVESLVLTSGLGLELELKMEDPAETLEQMGISPPDSLLKRLFLNQVPYRSGSPRFAQTPNLDDPATLRWDPVAMERTISLEALAYTVIAELEWGKRLEQFTRQTQIQTDSQRFADRQALLFSRLAAATVDFAEKRLKRADGLYWEELRWWRDAPIRRGPPPWRGQIAWLWALSALISSEESSANTDALTEELFRLLDRDLPWGELSVRDASLALKALAWFAVFTHDRDLQGRALRRVDELASLLLQLQPPEDRSLEAQAAIVSGLLYADHLTGDGRYRTAALDAWNRLLNLWDETLGVFAPQPTMPFEITIDEVGELLSAFHTVIYVTGDEEAKLLYAKFFQTLKRAGFQRAEGPEAGGGFDGDPVPDPRQVGEAPVLISMVRWDPEAGWQVSDGRFRTAPALYVANAWLWIGAFQGEGFKGPPAAGLPEDEAIRKAYLPRRVEVLRETLAQTQQELERFIEEMRALQEEGAKWEERVQKLESGLRDLRRQLERELQVFRTELQARSADPMLEARFEELQTRLEEQIVGQLEPLAKSLERFDQQLARLEDFRANLDRLRGEMRSLTERVSALEEGLPASSSWLVRPEILLLAVLLVGLALTTVGVLRLRQKA
jgi:uncharacterized coiled-coil protein SlyX